MAFLEDTMAQMPRKVLLIAPEPNGDILLY